MSDETKVYISKILVGNQGYLIKDLEAANHATQKNNPHEVTKADVGLGKVANKSVDEILGDMDSGDVASALGYMPIAPSEKGAANGIATLDAGGKVPTSQLPSFVDDVVEGYMHDDEFFLTRTGSGTTQDPYQYADQVNGETGKIYTDLQWNKTYRWGGSAFTEISASLALGTTSSTAFPGNKGQEAYTHAHDTERIVDTVTPGFYKIGVTDEGHVSSAQAVTKSDITGLGIPGKDTTYTVTNASKPCLRVDTQSEGSFPSLSMSVDSNETLSISLTGGAFPVYETQSVVASVVENE